jgi:hypothetical protein
MTDGEKLTALQMLTNEEDIDLLQSCLDFAKDKIVKKRFPFGDGTEAFPTEYDQLHLQLAQYLLLKTGAEGETVHLENGTSRHWEDGDVPASFMRQITPKGGVL